MKWCCSLILFKSHSLFLQRRDTKTSGFSLVELMIAIVLIGIIAGVGYPSYLEHIKRVEVSAAIGDIVSIEQAIARYEIAEGQQPPDLATIGMDTLLDPWERPYRYLSFDTNPPPGHKRKDHSLVPVNTDYDLYSSGKDGLSRPPFTANASKDDIVRANNGAFYGSVEDY